MDDVNRKMALGIVWMSLMRIGVKGLGVVSTIVLVRLLVPADFGLIAMAMSVKAALDLLRDFSFDVALIQKQDAQRSQYDTAWTLNVLFGLALAVILLLIALPVADFYNEPRLRGVMNALAIAVLITGFENVGVVAFRKDLAFHKEFILRIAQKASTIAVTLPLAFLLRNYWALIIGFIFGNFLTVAISYYAHPFRPRFSLSASGQLFSFSKWLLANNILWFLRDRTPDFVLGRIAGTTALGLFSVSNEISNMPTSELVAPINRAVFPAYAKMAHDLETLRVGFLNVIGLVVAVALPTGFGIAATAEQIVGVALGEKWLAAIPLVSLLGIYGALNALQTNCGAVFYALGQPRLLTIIGVVQAAFLLPSVVWGAYDNGGVGIAWAYVANAALVIVPLNYAGVLWRLQLPFGRLLSRLWRPAIATGAMYYVVTAWATREGGVSIAALVTQVALGAIVYVVVLILLWLAAGRPLGPERTATDRFLVPAWKRLRTALEPV